MIPPRRRQDKTAMNELNQQHTSLKSNPPGPTSNVSQMVPKQVVDIVDLATSVDNLSRSYRRQLELDTLSTKPRPMITTPLPTQMFSYIEMDEHCVCKQITNDTINDFPKGLEVPNLNTTQPLPPVDIHLKLRPDCKALIMELFPDLFDGVGTIKDAMLKLGIDQTTIPVIQPPRKIPQAIVEPLKKEIDRMMDLGVIQKLDINKATDWCHNLPLVYKLSGKLRVCLDPRTINSDLRFNVHNSRTFQDVTSSISRVKKVSKIDANSGFWMLSMDEKSSIANDIQHFMGQVLFHQDAIWSKSSLVFFSVLYGPLFPRHQFYYKCNYKQHHDSQQD